ncbi:hypothetical protein IMY05_015G0089400 [Salix suchowensis]|nr:hypothetical protein IMY05_015G0089400 [Salix suchowensis]
MRGINERSFGMQLQLQSIMHNVEYWLDLEDPTFKFFVHILFRQESRVNVQIFNGERVNNSNQKTITHSLVSVSSCPHNIYSFFDGKKTRTNMSDLSSE